MFSRVDSSLHSGAQSREINDYANKLEEPLWPVFCSGNLAQQALDSGAMHLRRIHHADAWEYVMPQRERSMKLPVYAHVLALNVGFEQVRRGFRALGRSAGFERSAIERFSEQAEENRAAAMSYIAERIQKEETDEAGRRFRKRVARERDER